MSWRLTPHSVRVFYLKNTMDGLEMYVHIYVYFIYFYIILLAWSFTHSAICTFCSYVCHTIQDSR